MSSLRLVYMGTPDFAVPALRALKDVGHDIVAIYCQPPKPIGRGQTVKKMPVHLVADGLGIPVYTPKTLRDEAEQSRLAAFKPDMIVVAAYGLILPQTVLNIPRLGCLNIHGSLLPRWRGAAPIHRAILAGDNITGITIMRMEAGLDTGPMYIKGEIPITSSTTVQTLHDEMATLGAKLIVEALDGIESGVLTPAPQPSEGVTYAAKLTKEDGLIDWNRPAFEIERQVRALSPWPSCYFTYGDETIKVLHAEICSQGTNDAGTLLDDRFTVACGKGALCLRLIQRAGKSPTDGASALRGMRLQKGVKFL